MPKGRKVIFVICFPYCRLSCLKGKKGREREVCHRGRLGRGDRRETGDGKWNTGEEIDAGTLYD